MPCSSAYMEPTPQERHQKLHAELDRLTAENDRLRELLLIVRHGGLLPDRDWEWIEGDQIKHRKEDLVRLDRRLREVIAASGGQGQWVDVPSGKRLELRDAYERLGRVVTADPSKPLQPQLGFDPDSI